MGGAGELNEIRAELEAVARPERAELMRRYFRTGPGEYGEGDVLLGVRVPDSRRIAGAHRDLDHELVLRLLAGEIHEERLVGLVIWTERHRRDAGARELIHRDYLANSDRVNNWDLVDLSAPTIVGRHLLAAGGDVSVLRRLAAGELLWDRRIAIVATVAFTRAGDTGPAYEIAELLLADEHDLIHKAVGWMLREAGKQDESELVAFVERHAGAMPRTTLRYAIERIPEAERARLLSI